jgi:lipopolysaccharide/colanic/teichoic acid biosynthesis glycosyltransferase
MRSAWVVASYRGGLSAKTIKMSEPRHNFQLALVLKRLFDVAMSAAALAVLSPLFLVVIVAIRMSSPGPVFYKATRVGKGGTPFKLYKFRSMVINADKVGPAVTTSGDPRVTPIGRFLRKTKLDELPQLLNVVRGEMSLVGPRPEDPRYVKLYTPEQRAVLNVRPGITSPASVRYRHEEAALVGPNWENQYINVVLPTKLAIDLEYVREPGVVRDISVLWQTARAVLN